MKTDSESLYEAAIALPEEERAVLGMRIIDSIGGVSDVEAAQVAESLDRLAAVGRGELDLLDHDAALRLIAG